MEAHDTPSTVEVPKWQSTLQRVPKTGLFGATEPTEAEVAEVKAMWDKHMVRRLRWVNVVLGTAAVLLVGVRVLT